MNTSHLHPWAWSKELSVLIEDGDEQHQVLIGLFNQLRLNIHEQHGKAASREALRRLAEATSLHFSLQESLMRLTNYTGYASHKQQHAHLLTQVHALQHRHDRGNKAISCEALHFYKNWLVQHIHASDRHFGSHFQKLSEGQCPTWTTDVAQSTQMNKGWRKFWQGNRMALSMELRLPKAT